MNCRLFYLILCGLLLLSIDANGQEYSSSVDLLEQTESELVVRSIGISDRKKDAEAMAIRSAFNTLFYYGITDYNNGKPLIQKDNTYYVNKFLNERYMMFCRNVEPISIEATRSTPRRYIAVVKFDIAIKSLIKDLVFEKLMERPIEEVTLQETQTTVGLPTIMVVPYTAEGQTYREVLQADPDLRMAIARVEEGFNKLGVSTLDFEARLDAMLRSREFNTSANISEEKLLADNSGTDVIVVVDFIKDYDSQGNRASLNMKAKSTASGALLASSVGWTNKFYTDDFDMLCVLAVEKQVEPFLNSIKLNLAATIEGGKSLVLRIVCAENSKNTLESGVGTEGYMLSSMIRRWVRTNAQDGKYHIQSAVATQMIFDNVTIPSLDVDGLPMDVSTFGDNLLFWLNSTLKVPCKMSIDGQTVHITIL